MFAIVHALSSLYPFALFLMEKKKRALLDPFFLGKMHASPENVTRFSESERRRKDERERERALYYPSERERK